MYNKADTQNINWIKENGMDVSSFNSTHPKLLKAQMTAHTLLKHHNLLLSNYQIKTLNGFLKKMAHKNTRTKLKPKASIPILNISTQINRKLFALSKLLN